MAKVWLADEVIQLKLGSVKAFHPRLEGAAVVLCFVDAKAFKNGRMNWGKVSKMNALTKALTANMGEFEFVITMPYETWSVLTTQQREALLDLHLLRCTPAYVPKTEVVNGKKIKVEDEFGKVEYSEELKLDKDGLVVWKILPLELPIFMENVSRHGKWCPELECIAVQQKEKPRSFIPGHDVCVTINEN